VLQADANVGIGPLAGPRHNLLYNFVLVMELNQVDFCQVVIVRQIIMGMKSADGENGALGKQGRVKDPTRDRRLAQNRSGPTGQGRVKHEDRDRRLSKNRPGPTGQGKVKNPEQDRRLAVNREGPTGQGRVKEPEKDRRLAINRRGSTGQGQVKDRERDRRLQENRQRTNLSS